MATEDPTDSIEARVEQLNENDEELIREVARQEAREVYDIDVEDGNGENWSLFELVDNFGITRRTALKAMGLMAVGSSATVAVLEAISGEAKAATGEAGQWGTPDDRPDVYLDNADINSVDTGELFTAARGPRVVVQVRDDGTIVADGESNQIASGDFSSRSDTRQVIQSAIDAGGHVLIRQHDSPYQLDKLGPDARGGFYCLEMQTGTDLEIEMGATLEYPAENVAQGDSNRDIATVIEARNVSNFRIRGRGTVDAGVHPADMNDATDNTEVIKIGVRKQDGATSCSNFEVRDITITGGYRHGIEVGDQSEDGRLRNLRLDDASSDDDVSISDRSENIVAIGCVSRNKIRRHDFYSSACYEIEDGARNCHFIRCWAIEPESQEGGFHIGKGHTGADFGPCFNCTAVECTTLRASVGSLAHGFMITSGPEYTSSGCGVVDCHAIGCEGSGVFINAGGATIFDPFVDGGKMVNNGVNGVLIEGSADIKQPHISGRVQIKGNTPNGIRVNPNAGAGLVEAPSFEDSLIRNNDGAAVSMSGTASEYAGRGYIRENEIKGNTFQPYFFDDDAIRGFVLTLDNGVAADLSPTEPFGGVAGEVYWDDGSNTSSGTEGKRAYLGGGWVDAFTA